MNLQSRQQVSKSRTGFTLVELLVVIAIIGILIALLLPAVQAARAAARRATCASQIKNIALAVLNYDSARKTTPAGMRLPKAEEPVIGQMGTFQANWIISILPFIEEQPLYDTFDLTKKINDNTAPLSSNRNYVARGTLISVLLCPDDDRNRIPYQGAIGNHGGNWARGNYAANSGGAYLYHSCNPPDLCSTGPTSAGWQSNKRRGVMGPNASVPIRKIPDGTSKTIMLGEIRSGLTEKDARGTWAMGHAGASLLAMFGSEGDANGPNACYITADDVYSDVCGTQDCKSKCMDCDPGYFAQATVRSNHLGGAHIAMCDGSVRLVQDTIETSGQYGSWGSLWDRMIASADGGMSGAFLGTMP
jgi:prepilin-type N-terminal cleavage/methylation domain-containing protein/prepilin-type processing-associated H-X9-DG protein